MVLGTLLGGLEVAKGLGSFVTQKLDERDVERFARGLERPETIIGEKQAAIARRHNIPSHFLINEPTEALQRLGFFDE